jgi:hypothetical protein
MVKSWAKFMYEDQETLVSAGDYVQERPGIRHYLFGYSPGTQYLDIVSPADFKSIEVTGVRASCARALGLNGVAAACEAEAVRY